MYYLTVLWFLLEALRESRPSSLQRLALLGSAGIAPISASIFPGLLLWVSGLLQSFFGKDTCHYSGMILSLDLLQLQGCFPKHGRIHRSWELERERSCLGEASI